MISGEIVHRIVPHYNDDIWLATNNGITIWDGSSFSTITETGGVELEYVDDLVSASDSSMWIGTYSDGVIVHSDSTAKHITKKMA